MKSLWCPTCTGRPTKKSTVSCPNALSLLVCTAALGYVLSTVLQRFTTTWLPARELLPNQSHNSSTICCSLPRSKPCRNISCCSCPPNAQHSGLALGTVSWFCTAVDHCCLLVTPALQASPLHPNSCFPCSPLPREPLPSSPTPLHHLFYRPQGSLRTFGSASSTLSGSPAPRSFSHFPTLHLPYFSNSFHVSRIYTSQNLPASFGVKLYS